MAATTWLCALVLSATAGPLDDAATALAQELASGLKGKADKLPDGPFVLAPLGLPEGDAALASFPAALTQALTAQGLKLIDRAAVAEAIAEKQLTGTDDAALAEGAAMGAAVSLVGTVTRAGDAYRVELRALNVKDGALLASATVTAGAASANPEPSTYAGLEAQTLEVELRRLADTLAKGLAELPGEIRYQRIAVLPFEEAGETTHDKQLGTLVPSELTTILHRDHGLLVVERSALAKVIEELALGQTGLVDEKQSVEVGKLAGAQALIVGTVSEVGDRYLVDARVVSVATGEVALAASGKLPAADLIALSSEAVVLRTRAGSVYRSLLLPGWGQVYNRQPEKAAVFVGAEALGLGVALAMHLRGKGYEDEYEALGTGSPPESFAVRRDAEDAYRLRNIALYVTLGIHALNVVDALVFGKTFDSATPGGGAQ